MARGDRGRHERWGREARLTPNGGPTARERKSEIGGGFTFVVLLFLYISVSRAEDTKKATTAKDGEGVKRGGGLRGLWRDRGRLLAALRATLMADAPRRIRGTSC